MTGLHLGQRLRASDPRLGRGILRGARPNLRRSTRTSRHVHVRTGGRSGIPHVLPRSGDRPGLA
eukprot:983932-Alexandrium_andersonii.AAC.1